MTLAVRPATEADLPVLAELWASATQPRRTPVPTLTTPAAIEERLTAALDDPDAEVLVATNGGPGPVGMLLLNRATLGIAATPALQMSNVVVEPSARRRGVGRALVSAAAAYAEHVGIEQLVVNVDPGRRDLNRYYARLGFMPISVRRVAPASMLRRRLAAPVRFATRPVIAARRARLTRS